VQIFFISLLMIAFFGGILSKCNSNHSSEGASFFNVLGFKTKEQLQAEQLNKYLSTYLKDKDNLLGDIQQDVGPLSQAVRDASVKNDNVDLLRLKNLMAQFEDQNVLMIQDGKELLAFNDKQKKLNKKMADKSELDAFLSRSSQQELIAKQKDTLAQMQSNQAVKNNPQLAEKLNAVYNKTMSRLDTLKQQQEQLQYIKQNNSQTASSIKMKIEDQKRHNEDLMRDNNDRMRDQMERMKDRSRR
jgi:hypothetical protein